MKKLQCMTILLAQTHTMSLPKVLLIALEPHPLFDLDTIEALLRKSVLLVATSAESAIQYIGAAMAAVIIADPSVIEPPFTDVASKITQYAQDGGTLIFGVNCSGYGTPEKWTMFFERTLNLPWRFHLVLSTAKFSLNPAVASNRFRSPAMPKSYSMKAMHLTGAPLDSLVYVSTNDSPTESNMLASMTITNDHEGPVVLAKYGRGHIGWIGDVDYGAESKHVLVVMCDLDLNEAQDEFDRGTRRQMYLEDLW